MACFLVPTAEAIVATIVARAAKAKEKEQEPEDFKIQLDDGSIELEKKIPFSHKLKWLTNMLWGGAILLAFEHLWHGEVVPWFPFLTAAENPTDLAAMFHEMATVGVSMALLVTAVWGVMLIVSNAMEKREQKESHQQMMIN